MEWNLNLTLFHQRCKTLQGVRYDYRSIMHYDSAAFSRNGKNTIEAMEDGFTNLIGAAKDLLNKLYQCQQRPASMERRRTSALLKKGFLPPKRASAPTTIIDMGPVTKPLSNIRSTRPPPNSKIIKTGAPCQDHFLDCPGFKEYCRKVSFFFVMKAYCPATCGHC
ncbi:Metalloendopeptidase [Aphelenchoides bicaudatus]|nr:Metalloendopeptidase [Aphelenchoides bicaudatus]